jgi:hypothetical protein
MAAPRRRLSLLRLAARPESPSRMVGRRWSGERLLRTRPAGASSPSGGPVAVASSSAHEGSCLDVPKPARAGRPPSPNGGPAFGRKKDRTLGAQLFSRLGARRSSIRTARPFESLGRPSRFPQSRLRPSPQRPGAPSPHPQHPRWTAEQTRHGRGWRFTPLAISHPSAKHTIAAGCELPQLSG